MASAPQIDLTAQLGSFLLRGYVATFYDLRHTPEERLKSRMDLESFLLSYGPKALKELQRAFNVQDQQVPAASYAAGWFISFVSSRDENWLRAVNLGIIERFWRTLRDVTIRRGAIDLITKVEATLDPSGASAFGSLLIALFREKQPDPFADQLATDSSLIVDCLLTRIKLTPPLTFASPQGNLAQYCLRVLRYCFRDRFETLTDSEAEAIVALAGDVSENVKQHLRSLTLT